MNQDPIKKFDNDYYLNLGLQGIYNQMESNEEDQNSINERSITFCSKKYNLWDPLKKFKIRKDEYPDYYFFWCSVNVCMILMLHFYKDIVNKENDEEFILHRSTKINEFKIEPNNPVHLKEAYIYKKLLTIMGQKSNLMKTIEFLCSEKGFNEENVLKILKDRRIYIMMDYSIKVKNSYYITDHFMEKENLVYKKNEDNDNVGFISNFFEKNMSYFLKNNFNLNLDDHCCYRKTILLTFEENYNLNVFNFQKIKNYPLKSLKYINLMVFNIKKEILKEIETNPSNYVIIITILLRFNYLFYMIDFLKDQKTLPKEFDLCIKRLNLESNYVNCLSKNDIFNIHKKIIWHIILDHFHLFCFIISKKKYSDKKLKDIDNGLFIKDLFIVNNRVLNHNKESDLTDHIMDINFLINDDLVIKSPFTEIFEKVMPNNSKTRKLTNIVADKYEKNNDFKFVINQYIQNYFLCGYLHSVIPDKNDLNVFVEFYSFIYFSEKNEVKKSREIVFKKMKSRYILKNIILSGFLNNISKFETFALVIDEILKTNEKENPLTIFYQEIFLKYSHDINLFSKLGYRKICKEYEDKSPKYKIDIKKSIFKKKKKKILEPFDQKIAESLSEYFITQYTACFLIEDIKDNNKLTGKELLKRIIGLLEKPSDDYLRYCIEYKFKGKAWYYDKNSIDTILPFFNNTRFFPFFFGSKIKNLFNIYTGNNKSKDIIIELQKIIPDFNEISDKNGINYHMKKNIYIKLKYFFSIYSKKKYIDNSIGKERVFLDIGSTISFLKTKVKYLNIFCYNNEDYNKNIDIILNEDKRFLFEYYKPCCNTLTKIFGNGNHGNYQTSSNELYYDILNKSLYTKENDEEYVLKRSKNITMRCFKKRYKKTQTVKHYIFKGKTPSDVIQNFEDIEIDPKCFGDNSKLKSHKSVIDETTKQKKKLKNLIDIPVSVLKQIKKQGRILERDFQTNHCTDPITNKIFPIHALNKVHKFLVGKNKFSEYTVCYCCGEFSKIFKRNNTNNLICYYCSFNYFENGLKVINDDTSSVYHIDGETFSKTFLEDILKIENNEMRHRRKDNNLHLPTILNSYFVKKTISEILTKSCEKK